MRAAPKHPQAWRALGDALSLTDDMAGANVAYARHIQASVNDPQLLEAAAALCDGKLAIAERLLRDFLKENPTDVAAIRMLAETGSRLARYEDAEKLLARCLELAPSFDMARHNYATVLYRQNKSVEAIEQLDLLLQRNPRDPGARSLKAACAGAHRRIPGRHRDLRQAAQGSSDQPKAWMSYGHSLKTVGRTEDGIAAYRQSIALLPSLGEAYWSLANLKTFRFTDADIAAMRAQLARSDLGAEDRLHFHFALGKALEDRGEYEESFAHYEQGNATAQDRAALRSGRHRRPSRAAPRRFSRRISSPRAPDGAPRRPIPSSSSVCRAPARPCSNRSCPAIRRSKARWSCPTSSPSPSGWAATSACGQNSAYPEALAALDAADDSRAGRGVSRRARASSANPAGLSSSTRCPTTGCMSGSSISSCRNAKIIDARRHPLACCFSNFKQHFARGQGFTYSLADIGRYYADYVEAMAHIDTVLPGRVHRVIYEDMVADPGDARCAGCSTIAACRSRNRACASTKTNGPCAPPVPNRSASRSSAKGWISGDITSRGWAR